MPNGENNYLTIAFINIIALNNITSFVYIDSFSEVTSDSFFIHHQSKEIPTRVTVHMMQLLPRLNHIKHIQQAFEID